jgi:hypothetical protein
MGERKTPQEKRCGSAKKRSLSNHGFYGRKTEGFRSRTATEMNEFLWASQLQFSGVRRASRPTFVNVCMIYGRPS